MSNKSKTKQESLIASYVKKNLAIKNQEEYYGIIDGIETLLGKDEQSATQTIEAVLEDGKQFESYPSRDQDNQTAPSEDNQVPKKTLDSILQAVEFTETEDSLKVAIAEQLGKMTDLKPNTRRGNFIIYVDGIESDRWTDPKISKDHWVKNIPLVFFWPKKADNVENGGVLTNDGWTVLDKKMAARLKITVHRDDTPNLPFYTVKSHVLCCARKDQFLRKKILQRLRGNMALPKMLATREEAARNAAVLSKQNVAASSQVFANDLAEVRNQTAQNMNVRSNGNMSVEQAQQMIDNASSESLVEIEKHLTDQIGKGNIGTNTQVSGMVPDTEI